MSSSLLLQQCPVYLVRLTLIVFVRGGRWLYSSALWGVASTNLHETFLALYIESTSSIIGCTSLGPKMHMCVCVSVSI